MMSDSTPPKQTAPNRQAVIVIHGIGEQQPMNTLREFVDGVFWVKDDVDDPPYYSKPDLLSQGFELRRLTTPGNIRPRTDFFEFYWAHLMPKAPWSKIIDWAWLMMRRKVQDVPVKFQWIWLVLWIGFCLFIALIFESVLYVLSPIQDGAILHPKIPFFITLAGAILSGSFLSYVGDAATYLSPYPANVAARHAIRSAGVALLESIHESGKYDRIIIVGHSLGSIIGYDILNFSWQRYYEKHGSPDSPQRDGLKEAEKLAVALHKSRKEKKMPQELRAKWMELVQKTREELHNNGHRWLVTDFVTLGSPLAHADLLLAKSHKDLDRKIAQREFPVSPPVVNSKGLFSFEINYELHNGSPRTTFVPHHAAWTACVCWTNLYFPSRWILKGDFVGGPLIPLFGLGIRDVPVSTKNRCGWLAHTNYWKRDNRDIDAEDNPISNLQAALNLGFKHLK
jgi:hypothetical protein